MGVARITEALGAGQLGAGTLALAALLVACGEATHSTKKEQAAAESASTVSSSGLGGSASTSAAASTGGQAGGSTSQGGSMAGAGGTLGGQAGVGQSGTAGGEAGTGASGAGGVASGAGGTAGSAGVGGMGNSTGQGGGTGVATTGNGGSASSGAGRENYTALLACDGEEPCPAAWASVIAGSLSATDVECLVTALRDRTPGRYELAYSLPGAGLSTQSDYVFYVDGTDQVLVLHYYEVTGSSNSQSYSASTCTLKSYEDLDQCIASGYFCIPDWYTDCRSVTDTTCPGE